MSLRRADNSTNVRFIVSLVAAAGAGGCAATTPVARPSTPICDGTALAICERHGPERHCECIERRAVRESVDRLGAGTRVGAFDAPGGN